MDFAIFLHMYSARYFHVCNRDYSNEAEQRKFLIKGLKYKIKWVKNITANVLPNMTKFERKIGYFLITCHSTVAITATSKAQFLAYDGSCSASRENLELVVLQFGI